MTDPKVYHSNQRGATIVLWLIAMLPVLGAGAFAIDLNNLRIAQAELQAAADAGALEGARQLFVRDEAGDFIVNTDVGLGSGNDPAARIIEENFSRNDRVEVVSVERGHWQFRDDGGPPDANGIWHGGAFIANENDETTSLTVTLGGGQPRYRNLIDEPVLATVPDCPSGSPNTLLYYLRGLNNDPCHVNAVRVTVESGQSIRALLGELLGISEFAPMRASAVAYIGFPSYIEQGDIDAPLALCGDQLRSITNNNAYSCMTGRFSPNGTSGATISQWINFEECGGDPVDGADLTTLINRMECPVDTGMLDLSRIDYGAEIEVNENNIDAATEALRLRWLGCQTGCPDRPWILRVPVIECQDPSGNPLPSGQCKATDGVVGIQLLFVSGASGILRNSQPASPCRIQCQEGGQTRWLEMPPRMTGVSAIAANGELTTIDWDVAADVPGGDTGNAECEEVWDEFVERFNIQDADNNLASWSAHASRDPTYYFRPHCTPLQSGGTGGQNFGVRARVPVLVD